MVFSRRVLFLFFCISCIGVFFQIFLELIWHFPQIFGKHFFQTFGYFHRFYKLSTWAYAGYSLCLNFDITNINLKSKLLGEMPFEIWRNILCKYQKFCVGSIDIELKRWRFRHFNYLL